jgi:hypothetical protein
LAGYLTRACRKVLRLIAGSASAPPAASEAARIEADRLSAEIEQMRKEVHAAQATTEHLRSSVYAAAARAFADGELDTAEALFTCYLEASGQVDLLKDRTATGCPAALDYEEFEPLFRAFLASRQVAWRSSVTPLPAFLARREAAASPLRTARKLLFILPRYIFNSDQHVECDMADHLCQSAANAGFDADCFFGDNILYPQLGLNHEKAVADLAELRTRIATTRPDAIVFDANFVGGDIGLNGAFLREVKAATGTRLIGFMGDVWGTHWVTIAQYWGEVADRLFYIVPEGRFIEACACADRMLSSPYPVNSRNFFPDPLKEYDLSFFGSHAYLRPFWLGRALRVVNRLGLVSNIRTHARTNDCPSMAEYSRILRHSRMVLNFSSRGRDAKIITGRAWQALHAGTLLLEEENDQTPQYFVPFVHYVPFENAAQLALLIEFFHKNPDLAATVGQAAAAFCIEYYSATAIWNRILDAAMREALPPERKNSLAATG